MKKVVSLGLHFLIAKFRSRCFQLSNLASVVILQMMSSWQASNEVKKAAKDFVTFLNKAVTPFHGMHIYCF